MYLFRLLIVSLTIWGLVIPPLFAAAPSAFINEGARVAVVSEFNASNVVQGHQDHDTRHNDQTLAKPACHNYSTDNLPSQGDCADCPLEYSSGSMCGTSCVLSGITTNYAARSLPGRESTGTEVGDAQPLYSGFFNRIYYPPKLS